VALQVKDEIREGDLCVDAVVTAERADLSERPR
jgi:hypothetical protein